MLVKNPLDYTLFQRMTTLNSVLNIQNVAGNSSRMENPTVIHYRMRIHVKVTPKMKYRSQMRA